MSAEVVVMPPRAKMRNCLRCTGRFLSEGPHNRICKGCREVIARDPSPEPEYTLSLHESR